MESWRVVKAACDFCSEIKLRETVISTILPDEMLGGRRMEGNSIWRLPLALLVYNLGFRFEGAHTSLLSWVSSTATPASTLPTVNEINIMSACVCDDCGYCELRCDNS